ncbi:glycosyltransferase [Geomonas sp. Red32]|uniref:glycosyltransferase n=1 Tax=Geomonas sp. Red32 TaxID=2912856 RepID=UPI00202CAE50|nr:glycosyltransferase [Geomonas sp. Red32]MCM0081182.1 glycosyltransferase [Geomonas sp. Red32]
MTEKRRLQVGIPVIGYKNWMGGVSYIELLVKALSGLPEDERPELYQIVTEESLPRLELHQHFLHLFKAVIFIGPYNKEYPDFIYTPTHRDLLDVLDFFFPLMNGAWPTAKAGCWIPDFQHLHLPQFFHEGECRSRSECFSNIARDAKLLILSSRDAQNDFRRFFPGSKAITRVLSFYAMPQESWYQADCAEVQQKYGLPDNFLICCNQFWAHKNHAMLFTAIGELHAEGTDIHLVCTGHTEDYRCPGFFDDLKERIRSMGVEHLVHILGSIPRHDQIQLVRRSMALVQPSLFEGWSTVIEDCRALGKIMLLSDLPVHQEQAPRNGQYFDRASLPSLKAKLKEMVPTLTPGPQYELERVAREEAHRLVLSYGRQFCAIARDAIAIDQGAAVSAQAPSAPAAPAAPAAHAAPTGSTGSTGSTTLPRITIVTPSFNQAEHLENCIQSVLSQGYPNLEYIIMDGGSTDGSVEIIKKYENRLAYWQSRPDGGQYRAVNEGFRRSTGEIMGWLNSDDMLHPGGLKVLVDVFMNRPDIEFLTGKRVGFDGEGNLRSYGFETQTWSRTELLRKELIHQVSLFVMQEATYWRRSLWEKAGGTLDFSYKLAADFELWLRFSRHAKLHTVDALLGGFRYYSGGQRCNQFRGEYIAECDDVIDRERQLPCALSTAPPPPLIAYPLQKGVPDRGLTPSQNGARHPGIDAPTEEQSKPSFVILVPKLPKISIVTPSFNQASFLEECLDSVLSQNYPNLEYIVMDGGSSDGSADIIKKYEKHLAYWQSRPDGGHYLAVNEGFGRSTGEIMAWLNSDDKYHPGSFRLVADAFRFFPETSWITGSPTGWDASGALLYMAQEPPLWSREKYLAGEIGPPHIQQESTFWRRSLWDLAGGTLDTELGLAADMELWTRFFRHAQLTTLHAPLGGFRNHPEQKTATMLERYNAEAAQVIERERRYFQATRCPALAPAPAPLQVADVESRAHTSVTAENFGAFTYSRTFHFAYFAGRDLELYGAPADPSQCDLKVYQDLLVYSFIKNNVPAGSRILEVGGGASRVLRALKDDYECWNLDKLEGLGNGPVGIEVDGFKLVREYLGSFTPELADGYFDLVFSISVLEHVPESEENFAAINRDIDRLLKPGGWSLHCFDVVARGRYTWGNGLLPYLFKANRTVNRWAPFEQLYPDPYVYAMSEAAYDRHWKPMTKTSFREHGFPLSYNILWQKPSQAPEEAAATASPPCQREDRVDSMVTTGEANPPKSPFDKGDFGPASYLVSAIVSTYNAEKFFRGCLEDLFRQTLYRQGQLEIIIIDSGSQQNEGEIARELMASHPHIVYRRTERETLYAAWNRGIALAHGRFLTHANTDDRHRADCFEMMAQELERSGKGLAYVDALMTCGANETFEENSATKKWLLPDFDLRQALFDCPFGCQVMWRADAHGEIGTFDQNFKRAGDYEFFFRLALRKGALHIPEIAVLYHESIDNLSYQNPQEVMREVRGFIGTPRTTLPLDEIYPFLKSAPSREAWVAVLVDFGNLLMGCSGSLFTDLPLAEQFYRKALELMPGKPEVVDNLAVAAMAQGKREAAIAAIALSPEMTPRLRGYLDELNAGRIPTQLNLIRVPHPGLDAMPPVKLLEEIRVPLAPHERPVASPPAASPTHPGAPPFGKGGQGGISGLAEENPPKSSFSKGGLPAAAMAGSAPYPTVVVDGVFFMTPKTGITRVWEALLTEWGKSGFGKSVVLLDRIGTAPKIPGLRYRTLPAYSARPEGVDRARVQKVCDEEGADLFISTYYSSPLTTPSLFLSHDMIPEMSGLYDLNDAQWTEKRHAMARASAYVAVSQSTARNMESLHPELAGHIEVAHCGIDRTLFRPASEQEKSEFRKARGLTKPYFLFVGKRTEHKNGKLLFQAFSRLPDREEYSIVCVGGAPQLEPELAALAAGCEVHLANFTDEELRLAYACAAAFVYPSTHEGFGLPLLEAMACHCPVITCQNSSIPEVAGAAALYVDPDSPDQLAADLINVLNPDVRSHLIKTGLRQVEHFSWEKMARTIQEIICLEFPPAAASPAAAVAPAGRSVGTRLTRSGMAKPKISLVIPSYNYAQYLEACLDSILSQEYPNLELIVMDGGSTDGTVEIIKKHERHIAFWRSHRDDGQYSAIEEGLNRATGEILGWLNADDMFHPGAFETVSTIFMEHPEIEWVMGRPNSFDEAGNQKHILSFLPMNSRAKYLADEELIQQEGTFWRRGLWERSGSYIDTSLKLAADLELWARFFRGAKLYSIEALIAGFRDHPLQKSKDKAGYTEEANRVLAREREIFAAEKRPYSPPAPLPILVGDRPPRYPQAEEQRPVQGVAL